MMGESDVCYTLQDDSNWEDVVNSTALCTLEEKDEEEKDEDEGAEDDEDVEDAAEGAEEAAAGKTKYSDEFKSLVLGLRRRSFTQGGIDAVVDLHTARALCQDFITSNLTTSRDEC